MLWILLHYTWAEPAVPIPAGSFLRGSGRSPDDSPQHTVQLSAFSIDLHEVTISEFESFVQDGWNRDENWSPEGLRWRNLNPSGAQKANRAADRSGNHPVVAVSWYEADAYCRFKGGHLPSEAQWERAACSNRNDRFPWGDSEDVEAVWYSGGKYGHLQSVLTKPVDQAPKRQRTADGLFHTVGNVWEWTADWYHKDSYQNKESPDPVGPSTGTWKTLRGGSFMNLPSYCTCTHREPARPDRVSFTVGFRCAYSTR
ncbi:MAG: formylglycine-generating enzyme family protein [Myxococcota bacterium]|nr:formylglycine-generating enzyme family protein [Myxococcota bacterium]